METKSQGPRPPWGRILIAHSDVFRRTKWFAYRTFGAYRYMKDPVARGWVQIGQIKAPQASVMGEAMRRPFHSAFTFRWPQI